MEIIPSKLSTIVAILSTISWLTVIVKGNLFSSMAKMAPLVQTEEELLYSVHKYLRLEKQRLSTIERIVDELQQERSVAAPSGGIDLGNPIQSYLLIRRLRRQWHDVKSYVSNTTNQRKYLNKFMSFWHSDGNFPMKEDLTGSIKALLRLQEIYLLKTSELADGRLQGQLNSTPLQASDCFDIGQEAWTHSEHFYSSRVVAEWMLEALRKDKQNYTEIHEDLGTSRAEAGKLLTELDKDEVANVESMQKSINITYHLVKQVPTKTPAPNLERTFSERIASTPDVQNITDEARYYALCRGEIKRSSSIKKSNAKSLICRFNHYNQPGLQIRPAKEEILATEPPIVYYHEMLTDQEIKALKEQALPLMEQSMVGNTHGEVGKSSFKSEIRVSNIAWIWHDTFKSDIRLERILPRVQSYCDFNVGVTDVESMQVANYGLGGHYHPHYDDYTEGVHDGLNGMGKRIATILYYLSDVEAGGATVFIKPGVRVPPVKGSAVLWYNYLKNGDRDMLTLHAGCPVLKGSKWASNLWIRERGQVFRRKCGLTKDEFY